jgi:hypothetical protein
LPAEDALGVAVEGSTKAWPASKTEASLPEFSPYDPEPTHYIDVFARGQAPVDYTISCDAPWVKFDSDRGTSAPERRIEVSVDWAAAPVGASAATITSAGPDEQTIVVRLAANKPPLDPAKPVRGVVEAGGRVAIDAEHFSRAVEAGPVYWQCIADLGRTLSGVTPMPVTAARQTPNGEAPRLEYRVHLFHAGDVRLSAYASPTLDFTGGDGLRYAVSVDDAEPQVVNINANTRPGAWDRTVGDNINITQTKHAVAEPGEHVLKFWMVDPGIVLQRLVVETTGAPPSYLGPPESVCITGESN